MSIALSSTRIQTFSNQLSPLVFFFFFLTNFVAAAAWSGIQRVEPQMIFFKSFFITSYAGATSPLRPPLPQQHFL